MIKWLTYRLPIIALALGCNGDDLDSDAEARLAYLGFDSAVDLSLELGFDGFNAASSANIATQTGDGTESGTMSIDGQVDQGASSNKGMRLEVLLVDYRDGAVDDTATEDVEEYSVTYDTNDGDPLLLDLSLRDIPTGTFTGTLAGSAVLSGDLEAEATFNLTLSGGLVEDPEVSGGVARAPGTLTISGTVTSSDGTFEVDVAR